MAEGFSSVDAYLLFLVFEAQAAAACSEDEDEETADDEDQFEPPPGASYAFTTREELEAKLLEGLNSGPPIRVTPEFWRDRRKALAERLINRQRGVP